MESLQTDAVWGLGYSDAGLVCAEIHGGERVIVTMAFTAALARKPLRVSHTSSHNNSTDVCAAHAQRGVVYDAVGLEHVVRRGGRFLHSAGAGNRAPASVMEAIAGI